MKKEERYSIQHNGLSIGEHEFSFELDEVFFKSYENTEIKNGDVKVLVIVSKSKTMLSLKFSFDGAVTLECDRCLEDIDIEISGNAKLYVEFGEESSDLSDADNKITLSYKENLLVLDKHIYDYINLSLPYQRVHPEDDKGNSLCNNDMIEKINQHTVTDNEKKIDPRWDKLKTLLN